VTVAANNTANNDTRFVEMDLRKMRLNYMNNKQLTNNERHGLDSHKEQLLLFSLVHLILC
jgi:hypothetical protein